MGWSLDADPDSYSYWHSSQVGRGFNFVGYESAVVDQALEDGRTKCSRGQRQEAYRRVNAQLNQDQPYNFGVASKTVLAYASSIRGVDQGPWPNRDSGVLWNVETWSVAG
jgi:peptide/nickel transport system substrate-binding protein